MIPEKFTKRAKNVVCVLNKAKNGLKRVKMDQNRLKIDEKGQI